MALVYSNTALNAMFTGLIGAIDASGSGFLILMSGTTVLATLPMATPSGTVDSGVLIFSTPLQDGSADGTGLCDSAIITDAVGTVLVSNMSVGIPLSGADVIISNGLNSTLITAGQNVVLLSATLSQ